MDGRGERPNEAGGAAAPCRATGRDSDDLAPVWGQAAPGRRPPRILGVFAHPDDEVFCAGGTIARCAAAGATTALVSLTRGEAGEIRDAASATRRTLGDVRAGELASAAAELGADHAVCLDLGDGKLALRPRGDLVVAVAAAIGQFRPDVVVTFGPDGGSGHADHVASCVATVEAIAAMHDPPRLLHARFPRHDQLLLDLLAEWISSSPVHRDGTAGFAHSLRLFAHGSSMLGLAADEVDVEWFPAGSYVVEQGEPAVELYCVLSGSVDVVVEDRAGRLDRTAHLGPGCFFGAIEPGSGGARTAHVIASSDVTCLVLAPPRPDRCCHRDEGAAVPEPDRQALASPGARGRIGPRFSVDVGPALGRKVAALAAHRSQYAFEPARFPLHVLERLLGTEHFEVVDVRGSATGPATRPRSAAVGRSSELARV